MELTFLVDNNTLIDRYFLAEPGLSLLLEDQEIRVLFDTGYSDIFLRNAQKMALSLARLDFAVLSHGHSDHTWGIDALVRFFAELEIEGIAHQRPVVVAHPAAFTSVSAEKFREFGSVYSEAKLSKHFTLRLSAGPQRLGPKLVYLGQIPRLHDFEGTKTFGRKEGAVADDIVVEDSALVYQSSKGLVIVSGCAHAGICNTIEYAKKVCAEDRIADVVGGFHLQNPSEKQLNDTMEYLEKCGVKTIHACHCTDLKSKIALSRVVDIAEVGVGMKLSYP